MDESEMLEFAAKAAGWSLFYYGSRCTVQTEPGKLLEWNPLTDDGDALRLAVKLGLHVTHWVGSTSVNRAGLDWVHAIEHWKLHGDRLAATRRAITRAAAEIGRAMP